MLKKFNVWIILKEGSDGLICVSVNSIMSLFIILSSLTISISFEGDSTLRTKAVFVLSDCLMLFTFIVQNKSFCFKHSGFIVGILNFPLH